MGYGDRILEQIREWSTISEKIFDNTVFTEKEQHYLTHLIARKKDDLLDELENIGKPVKEDLY